MNWVIRYLSQYEVRSSENQDKLKTQKWMLVLSFGCPQEYVSRPGGGFPWCVDTNTPGLSCMKPLQMQAQLLLGRERRLGGKMFKKHQWKDAWDFFSWRSHSSSLFRRAACWNLALYAGPPRHVLAPSSPCLAAVTPEEELTLCFGSLRYVGYPQCQPPSSSWAILGRRKSRNISEDRSKPTWCWSAGAKIKQVHSAPSSTATRSTNAFCCQWNFEESRGLHVVPYVGYHSAPRLSISGFLLLTPSITANGINCKSHKSILSGMTEFFHIICLSDRKICC